MADPVATSHHAIAPKSPRSAPGESSSAESSSQAAEASVTFTLDGVEATGHVGEFLIAAAERAGVFIPRFCYHPRMAPVGMCRMCLVEVNGPRGATLQPACYLPVTDGMEVVTNSDKVRKAQDGVIEFLLVNHPLDCPVCDKGGECPLQDQALAYGPGESRFVEEKRHWAKPIPISELVLLDRERCIQCGRCVRFAAEVAGEAEIDLLGRGDRIEVGIFAKQPFASYFSGNTVQICPVGALTAVPYRFTARPWDLDQVESTCTTCAVGCRLVVQSSTNRVTRLLGMDSDPVNQSWLCDKGRFGYESVNSTDRLVEPLWRGTRKDAGGKSPGEPSGTRKDAASESARSGDDLVPTTWAEALALVADRMAEARRDAGPSSIAVLGGSRLANEDAYAWAKLAKAVLGTDSVDAQLGDGLPAELVLSLPRATIDDACAARCVVLLTGDLREELPVLFLRLRSAVVDAGLPLVEIGASKSALSSLAAASLIYRPGELSNLTRALAAGAQAPEGIDAPAWQAALEVLAPLGPFGADGAVAGAESAEGAGIVVVLGRPSLAEHGDLVAEAAVELATAWPGARFLPALRRGNVNGALDMGLAPGVLPGRVSLDGGRDRFEREWGSLPAGRGRDAVSIIEAAAAGEISVLVLLGSDPLGDFPDRGMARRALERVEFVVAVDAFLSSSAKLADVVLPVSIQHERAGTTTNIEGRVTRVGQKIVAPGQCWPDWMIAVELASRLGGDLGVSSTSDIWDEIERLAPAYAGVTRAVMDSPVARDGVVVPLAASRVSITRRRDPERVDPIATPGIESVERQGAPPRAGISEPAGGSGEDEDRPTGDVPATPALISLTAGVSAPKLPPPDSYSLRLVSRRRLYDNGVMTRSCTGLVPLVEPAPLRANPYDLERLGVATGGRVRVRSARGSIVALVQEDEAVCRGVVSMDFNVEGVADGDRAAAAAGPVAADLVAAGEAVTDVRLETL